MSPRVHGSTFASVLFAALALSSGACGPRPASQTASGAPDAGPQDLADAESAGAGAAGSAVGPEGAGEAGDRPSATGDAATAKNENGAATTAEPVDPIAVAPPSLGTLPDGTAILPCGDAPERMSCVPGGDFIRGRDDGEKNEKPAATVSLQTFFIDTHEVTSSEYRQCRDAGACPKRGPLYNDFSRDRQPITGVSWYAARDYCAWVGKSLPTEAQWEKAARGPDGELFPWGQEKANCNHAIIQDSRGMSCGIKKLKEHPDKGRTFEVGSRPVGRYGLYDMSGNAWEWVADWASSSYAACGKACEGIDPKGPCAGRDTCSGHDEKVVRGGSWYWNASYATGTYRRTHIPENPHENFHHFGFRCAASVEQAQTLVATPPAVKYLDVSRATPDAGLGKL